MLVSGEYELLILGAQTALNARWMAAIERHDGERTLNVERSHSAHHSSAFTQAAAGSDLDRDFCSEFIASRMPTSPQLLVQRRTLGSGRRGRQLEPGRLHRQHAD